MCKSMQRLWSTVAVILLLLSVLSGCRREDGDSNVQSDVDTSQTTTINTSNDAEPSSTDNSETAQHPSGTTTNTKKTDSGTTTKTKDTEQSLRGTVVKFATWEDIPNTEYGPVIEDFRKKTGIRVQIIPVPQGDYVTKLSAKIAAGDSPDVLKDNGEFPRFFPLAQPITNAGINPNESRWNQQVTKMYTVNGKVYAIASAQPLFASRMLVIYNKKIFAENGITTPEQYVKANQWNWETLAKASREIANAPNVVVGAELNMEYFAAAYGGGFVKFDGSKIVSGDQDTETRDVWRYMLENVKEGHFQLQVSGHHYAFLKSQAGISINTTFSLKAKGHLSAMNTSDLGFTYLPKKKASDSDYPVSGGCSTFALAKGAPNPKGAGEFLKYYLNEDNYDLKSAYKSVEAQNFAKELASKPIPFNLLYIGLGTAKIAGGRDSFVQYIKDTDPAQIQSNLSKLKNIVNNAVSRANALRNNAGKN